MSNESSSSTGIPVTTMSSIIEPDLWAKMTVQELSRHGVGADKNTSYKLTKKVDKHGNYLEFPNITVVNPIALIENDKLASLPRRLQQTVGVYLSPLPSYHATLLCGPLHIDLNQPQQKGKNKNLFAECLQEPCWGEMATRLDSEQYAPTNLRVKEVRCKESGGVTVYLETSDGDDDTATQFRQELRELGVCQNLKESLCELSQRKDLGKKALKTVRELITCLMEPKDRPWHITIAYPRESGGAMPQEIQEQVKALVRDAFHTDSGFIPFEPAQLCLSPDMTTFVPWNGTANGLQ